jgi:YD repeat-containing protein
MLGLGWTLRLPSVRRQTDKGLPQYADTDLFYDENAEELVHLADDSYRQKIESTFIRYERAAAGGWLGRLPNGAVLSFGATNQSRLDWTGHGTFAWMVDSSQDPNGNRTEYYYRQDGQQIYPEEIRYGLHATQPSSFFSVQFGYSTNRPDPFVDCRARFASTNRLRLETVTVFYGSRRVRQYQFGYDTQAPASLLTSVTQFGDERSATNNAAQSNVDFLPPTRFGYTPYTIPRAPQVRTISFDAREPNFSFGGEDGNGSGNNAEFVDINHDGLPDILINSDFEWRSLLNPGPFTNSWPLSLVITNPPDVTGAGLGQPTTRLVDLRGDGRSKLMLSQSDVSPDQATAFYYYDFLSPTALGPAQPYFTLNGINLAQNEVQFVDLDDDKAMDLLRINGTGPFGFLEGLYTRNFEGRTNQYLTTPNAWGFDFTQGWQLADMNGDRLQDFVWLNGTDNTAVSLNLGWGQFAPPYLMAGGPDWATLQAVGTSGPHLIDLNQDGLADLVIVENQAIRIWFNQNGTSWSEPVVLTDTPVYQSAQTVVRFADINGNGSVDIIWHQGQDPFIQYVDLFPAGKAYLLNHASTTLGLSLDITYRSSTDFMSLAAGTTNQWTVVAPFPVPVISQIVEGDGLGNRYTNQFTYRNAYYDGLEREFRGFEQAVRRELGNETQGAPTLVTRFNFDTGATVEALKGKPLRVETSTDSGGVFYRQTNDWTPRVLALQQATGETRQVTFAFQNRKDTQEVELGTDADAVTLEEEFDYDDYGNEIRHADYGRVENGDRSAWADERIFVRQFSAEFPGGTNLWILDRLVTEQRQDLRGAVISQKHIFYDDQTFAGENLGMMTRGNPTLIREWIDTTNNIFRATLRQEYDSFGNVVEAYDPLGTSGRSDLGRYRQIEFDSQIHTFPIRETIYTANPDVLAARSAAPSLVAAADYDFGLGVMRSATDFNQNTTLFDFDTFGRLSRITKPYDHTNFPTAVFSYTLQQPVGNGQTVNFTQSGLREVADEPGTFDSRSYFDGLGRKVMTRTESETNAVVVVTEATQFNQRRKAWKSFLPYFELASLEFQPLVETNAFHETQYDALGREIVTYQPPTAPDGHRDYSRTIYGPLTRMVYDEEQTRPDSPHYGAGMRYTKDGLRDKDGKGRLRLVEEIVKLADDGLPVGNTNNWQTQYRYDLLDNFLGYTDSQGNQKAFRYDALSRKTFMNDPDRGRMSWFYDDASNLRETVDAKNQHIQYTYDGVNRLLTEDYKDEGQAHSASFIFNPALPLSSTNRPDVAYFYDAPVTSLDLGNGTVATAQNTKGFLAYVWDLTGEEHTSYDARERVTYTVKRIKDPLHGQLVSFRTGFAYDSLDRVTQLTYLDDDFVFYQYNARNLLTRISGGQVIGALGTSNVIAGITYLPSGQLAQIDYGNGVRTTYAYDPRLRL